MGKRAHQTYFTLVLALLALLGTEAFRPSPSPALAPALEGEGAVLPDLSGVWTGTWQDTIYMVGGDLSFEITSLPGGYSATGTIDLSILGIGEKQGSASGTVIGNQLDFTFSAADVGTGMGSLIDNSASGTGTVTAPLSFGDFALSGTANGEAIWGIFDFTSPTGGAGKAVLHRSTSTAETSLSAVKAVYDSAP